MLVAFNPTTEEILMWAIPDDGVLKTYLPAKCPAECCDIDCGCAEEDPACTHTDHSQVGQCVVQILLDAQGEPEYTCLGQIPRGSHMSDCRHVSLIECDCGVIDRYQTEIARKHGPARVAGRQKEKNTDHAKAIIAEAKARRLLDLPADTHIP